MRIPAIVAAAFALGSLGLTGCSTNAVSTVTHTPALQTNGGRATARSTIQTAIIATEESNGLAYPGGLTPATAMRIMRDVVHGRGAATASRGTASIVRAPATAGRAVKATGSATGPCNNGTKQSQTTNSDGTVTTTTDLYYDATCTTLENELAMTVKPPVSGVSSANGTLATYDKSGALTSSHVLTLTESTDADTGADTITLTDNAAATLGGTPIDSLGATCVGPPNSVAMTCTSAHYGTTNSTTTGEALNDVSTAGSGGAQNGTAIAATFFLGSLGIAESGTTWAITNATGYNSGTGAFLFSSAGNTGSGSVTFTDNLYTYALSGTLSSTGLSLTIVQNPNSAFNTTSPIATATVDAGGNGSMSYADGTVEPIWGGFIGD
ncbi:MAG TPA: hypothetical protein VHT53_09080 [Candidatus Elarobacter sp.]|nr:hypothetical protein [Candidatus Elarobacter sp.]